jgi:hypothetical protein
VTLPHHPSTPSFVITLTQLVAISRFVRPKLLSRSGSRTQSSSLSLSDLSCAASATAALL